MSLEEDELQIVSRRRSVTIVAVGEGASLAGWTVASTLVPGDESFANMNGSERYRVESANSAIFDLVYAMILRTSLFRGRFDKCGELRVSRFRPWDSAYQLELKCHS